MWRRASAKLSSLRSVARPNQTATSSLWSAIFRPSGSVTKEVEDAIPIATGHERAEPEFEIRGGDLVDHEFLKGPFGTKENPAVMRSFFVAQGAGCGGPEGAPHRPEVFWLYTGEIHVCSVCSQHFTLRCVGPGGLPDHPMSKFP